MDNDYIVQLITKLDGSKTADDLKKIEQQLNAKGINLKTSLDTATSKQELQTLAKQLQSVLKASGLDIDTSKIMSAFNQVTSEAKKVANQVNKIQHSLSVGDYDAQIETIKKGFIGLSGNAEEAETHVKGLRDALKSMHDATDDNGRLTAEKNYRLELEKTNNQLTIAKAKAKAYVDVLKVQKLRNDIQDWLKKNTAATKEAKDAMNAYLATLDDIGHVSQSTFNVAKQGLDDWDTKMRQAGKLGKSLTETFKEGMKSFTSWAISSGAVMEVWNGVKQSVTDIKELDNILTEISKTSDLTKDNLQELGSVSFERASKFGKSASDYLSGVLEMSRSGFSGEKGERLAETSILAQAAGDMTEEVANQYILATNAAYKYNGEAEKLNAVLDGQNMITNRNSVAMTDMATAMSEAGTVASSYRVSVEDLSAMIGTIESVTKLGGSEVGNGIKSILINLQNISSSKVVKTLNAANASMTEMVNGTEQLRDPISILRDLAKTFTELDEADPLRAEILTNIGGKYQATKLAALLDNMDMYDKMLADYSEGSGSAMKEAEKSANNFEGSLVRLDNTLTDIVNNVANSDFFIGLINGANTALALVEELTSSLGSLGTLGTIGAGILGSKGAGLTNYVTHHSLRVPFYKVA